MGGDTNMMAIMIKNFHFPRWVNRYLPKALEVFRAGLQCDTMSEEEEESLRVKYMHVLAFNRTCTRADNAVNKAQTNIENVKKAFEELKSVELSEKLAYKKA